MEETQIIDYKEYGLEETKANELTAGLKTILAERDILVNAYNDVIDLEITPENIDIFKSLRLKIRDNRTKGLDKWHKVNKEFFLAGGRFVDAIKNKEVSENERMEEKLLAAEKHFENMEKERLIAIHKERVSKLFPFGYEIGNVDFSSMDENMFNAILTGAEKNHNDKIEAQRIAEEARVAKEKEEAEERARIKQENERLILKAKTDRDAAEKALSEQKALADKALKDQQEIANKAAKAEADKQAKILADQKAVNDKLAKELTAKQEAEAKIKQAADVAAAEKIALEKKAAQAPDKDKLKAALNSILFPVLDMKTADSHKIYLEIQDKFSKMQKWANDLIDGI